MPYATKTVDVSIIKLICDSITPESGFGRLRDEVYIQVYGSTPSGNLSARLPRSHYGDDYYSFYNTQVSKSSKLRSWENQDGSLMGAPQIWSGHLSIGQEADLFIVIGEQDNQQITILRDVIEAALDEARGNIEDNPLASAAVEGARKFIGQLPDTRDDIIGVFHIHLRNENGHIRVVWLPVKKLSFRNTRGQTTLKNPNDHYAIALRQKGNLVQSFNFQGVSGGKYRGVAEVRVRDGAPQKAHRYLITEFDACSPVNPLTVYDLNIYTFRLRKLGTVGRGEVKSFPVSLATWYWKCGDSDLEHTNGAHSAIRYVTVNRHQGTGQIRWHCFNNEDW